MPQRDLPRAPSRRPDEIQKKKLPWLDEFRNWLRDQESMTNIDALLQKAS